MVAFNTIFKVHGVFQLLAVLSLFVGLYYALAKPKDWFTYHRALMITFVTMATLGALTALITVEYRGTKPSNLSKIHGLLGVSLILIAWLQLTWAIILRKFVERSTYLAVHRVLAATLVILAISTAILGALNMSALMKDKQSADENKDV